MPTKSIATSAHGTSWKIGSWKIKTLSELKAGLPLVVPACALGVNAMAKMVRDGLFVRGFPPESGDHIGLEIDGELSEFCVYRVHDVFHCEETREANPRQLRHSEDELTMHTLARKKFYEIMAADIGVTGQVMEVENGIWELGRKASQAHENSKVIFIEQGVPGPLLELTLMRDPSEVIFLLQYETPPTHDWHCGKTLFRGVIEVRAELFASDAFKDSSPSQNIAKKNSSNPHDVTSTNNQSLIQAETDSQISQKMKNVKLLRLVAPDFMNWKSIILSTLVKNNNHYQAFRLGADNMKKLVAAKIFYQAKSLDDLPETIWLDINDGDDLYEVERVDNKIHCLELSRNSYRENSQFEQIVYEFTLEEFCPHKFSRENFYALMANDLGITSQVCKLGNGLWELGRKNIAGKGRARIIFVEQGVEQNDIVACIALHGFKTNCLLFSGRTPAEIIVPDKIITFSPVFVEGGRFITEAFEDSIAQHGVPSADTRIELAEHPPKLWICGEEFNLPDDRGRPTLGARYLAYLIENPRTLISCWDIERMVKPMLKELMSQAYGSDERLDKKALRALDESIKEAKISLEEVMRDPSASQVEIDEAQSELDQLLEQKQVDSGKGGKSRLLGDTNKEKARRRVRKALDAVVAYVAKQNPAIREPLREAVGEGSDIYFNPPPDWNI
jgi:hypothetical protein